PPGVATVLNAPYLPRSSRLVIDLHLQRLVGVALQDVAALGALDPERGHGVALIGVEVHLAVVVIRLPVLGGPDLRLCPCTRVIGRQVAVPVAAHGRLTSPAT